MVTSTLLGNRYLSKFKPPPKCPLKPGVVDVSAADLILDIILRLPVEGFQWTIKGMFLGKRAKTGKMQGIGCIMVHFRVLKAIGKEETDPLAYFI